MANIRQTRQQIDRIRHELTEIGKPEALPEVIETTNMMRANEHLTRTDQKQSELLAVYADYTAQLEKMVVAVSDVRKEIDVLRVRARSIQKKKPSKKKAGKRRKVRNSSKTRKKTATSARRTKKAKTTRSKKSARKTKGRKKPARRRR